MSFWMKNMLFYKAQKAQTPIYQNFDNMKAQAPG